MSKGKIIVFSAASGAGKTTILQKLRHSVPELVYSISCTTRQPRDNELQGIHYHFISVEEFERKKENNEFAEWAFVHGNYYGTPKKFIDDTIGAGKHIVMDIDVYGKTMFDKMYPEATGILILPPNLQELERRLRSRNTETEEQIAVRIGNAEREMLYARQQGKYEYTIVNDSLERSYLDIINIVQRIIGAKK